MHLFTCSTFYVRTWPPPVLAPVGQLGVFLSKFLSPIMTHSTFTSPRLFLMCTHFHSPNIPSSYTTDHVHSFSPSSVLSSLAHLLHIIAQCTAYCSATILANSPLYSRAYTFLPNSVYVLPVHSLSTAQDSIFIDTAQFNPGHYLHASKRSLKVCKCFAMTHSSSTDLVMTVFLIEMFSKYLYQHPSLYFSNFVLIHL